MACIAEPHWESMIVLQDFGVFKAGEIIFGREHHGVYEVTDAEDRAAASKYASPEWAEKYLAFYGDENGSLAAMTQEHIEARWEKIRQGGTPATTQEQRERQAQAVGAVIVTTR